MRYPSCTPCAAPLLCIRSQQQRHIANHTKLGDHAAARQPFQSTPCSPAKHIGSYASSAASGPKVNALSRKIGTEPAMTPCTSFDETKKILLVQNDLVLLPYNVTHWQAAMQCSGYIGVLLGHGVPCPARSRTAFWPTWRPFLRQHQFSACPLCQSLNSSKSYFPILVNLGPDDHGPTFSMIASELLMILV